MRGWIRRQAGRMRRHLIAPVAQAAASGPWPARIDPAQLPAFSPNATEADIAACFRLLLNHWPDATSWPDHRWLAGRPLEEVVAKYLSTEQFQKRGLLRPFEAADVAIARQPGFDLFVSRRDMAVGMPILDGGEYEPRVQAAFRAHLRPGMSVVDVGANIGFFSMLAASLVGPEGRVTSVEPNIDNVRLLEASRRQNGFAQVHPRIAAAGAEPGLLALYTDFSNGTVLPIDGAANEVLASRFLVSVFRLDDLVPADQQVHLIKIDVEGAEALVLRGARRVLAAWRPVILFEFTPDMLIGVSQVQPRAMLEELEAQGYRLTPLVGDDAAYGADAVLAAQATAGSMHIDVLAEPVDQRQPH